MKQNLMNINYFLKYVKKKCYFIFRKNCKFFNKIKFKTKKKKTILKICIKNKNK